MARDIDRDDATAEGEEMVRDGNLVIEERISRRDGLVEYEGTVEGTAGTVPATPEPATATTRTEVVTTTSETVSPGAGSAAQGRRDPLSMSTDNTASGAFAADTVETGPIARALEGMRVVDASGEEIGSVDRVQMGDPSAATAQGEDSGDAGVAAAPVGLAGAGGSGAGAAGGGIAAPVGLFGGGDLDLPDAFAQELRRVGFVKIDGKGWFDRDRYAAADEIADVSGDTVRLGVGKDSLRTS